MISLGIDGRQAPREAIDQCQFSPSRFTMHSLINVKDNKEMQRERLIPAFDLPNLKQGTKLLPGPRTLLMLRVLDCL